MPAHWHSRKTKTVGLGAPTTIWFGWSVVWNNNFSAIQLRHASAVLGMQQRPRSLTPLPSIGSFVHYIERGGKKLLLFQAVKMLFRPSSQLGRRGRVSILRSHFIAGLKCILSGGTWQARGYIPQSTWQTMHQHVLMRISRNIFNRKDRQKNFASCKPNGFSSRVRQ
jgi:hypothetical protein